MIFIDTHYEANIIETLKHTVGPTAMTMLIRHIKNNFSNYKFHIDYFINSAERPSPIYHNNDNFNYFQSTTKPKLVGTTRNSNKVTLTCLPHFQSGPLITRAPTPSMAKPPAVTTADEEVPAPPTAPATEELDVEAVAPLAPPPPPVAAATKPVFVLPVLASLPAAVAAQAMEFHFFAS
ncbi:hypothetical protein FF38_07286 [Lucilia cuprina]|uniref:Uncharacterized protein n=1 Tax=Lucilia cuprina TaxID=7375 RepID=A0A0L0CJT4_LUCCU|nr:hypothetical protein FF38_07286 [Lucilia cuprina]